MTQNKHQLEKMIMLMVLVLVIIAGIVFVSLEEGAPKKRNHNAKRYDEGSLHYVHPDLIHYKQSHVHHIEAKELSALTVDSKGTVYVVADSALWMFTSELKKMNRFEQEVNYTCITTKVDKLITGFENKVYIINKKGQEERVIQKEEFGDINSIVAKGDSLFLADRLHKVIWKYNLKTNELTSFGSQEKDKKNGMVIPGPHFDLALSEDGLIYASNPGRHQVNGYTETGKLDVVFGRPSFKHEGFCGCCNPVALALTPEGNFVTSEKGIARVKVLNKNGDLLGIVAAPKDFKKSKHSYIKDIAIDQQGRVFLLEPMTNKLYCYEKKKDGKS